jgi:hypothetical protein
LVIRSLARCVAVDRTAGLIEDSMREHGETKPTGVLERSAGSDIMNDQVDSASFRSFTTRDGNAEEKKNSARD